MSLSSSEDLEIVEVRNSALSEDGAPGDILPRSSVQYSRILPNAQLNTQAFSGTVNAEHGTAKLPEQSNSTSQVIKTEDSSSSFNPDREVLQKPPHISSDEKSSSDLSGTETNLNAVLDLAQQISLLKRIHSGKLAPSTENVTRAFNREILMKAATSRQRKQVDTILNTTSTEEMELKEQISRRELQIKRLKKSQFSVSPQLSELSIDRLRPIVEGLSKFRLSDPPSMIHEECNEIIWALIEGVARNENLTVSLKSPIVRYLESQDLISVVSKEKSTEISIL